jgi:hypothetical protein
MTDDGKLGPNRTPPSLMDLVRRFDGYDKITPAGWAAYDREMAAYKADIASGALWHWDDEQDDEPGQ